MNAEQLHDAISLLPADLITETDKRRSIRRAPVRWQRFVAMAACLVLIFGAGIWCMEYLNAGGAKETAAEAPAAMQAAATDTCTPESMLAASGMEPQDAMPMEEPAAEAAPALDSAASNGSCLPRTPAGVLYSGDFSYPLTEADSAAILCVVASLTYSPESICNCLPEYTVIFENGASYEIHLTEGYVRCNTGQALLTQEQCQALQTVLDKITCQ